MNVPNQGRSCSFLEIARTAVERRWCVRPYCTTCGAMEFREALEKLSGRNGERLSQCLAEIDLAAFTALPGWPDMLRHALLCLERPEQGDRVLTAWLPNLTDYPRLADYVLFYWIRFGILSSPMSMSTRRAWVQACMDLAVASNDESLTESLIYTERERVLQQVPFRRLAEELARASARVRLALQQVTE